MDTNAKQTTKRGRRIAMGHLLSLDHFTTAILIHNLETHIPTPAYPCQNKRRPQKTKPLNRVNLIQILILIGITISPKPVAAAPPLRSDDPRRPVEQLSRDLGIPAGVFRACFSNVKPAALGDHPTRERVQTNKAILLACLQQSNPKINNHTLDTVMDRYRPGGKEAQKPQR